MQDSEEENDLSDIDPKLVSFIEEHEGELAEADQRVEAIIVQGDKRLERADQNLKRNLTGGMDENEAAQLYEQELRDIDAEVQGLLKALEEEYNAKYPKA